MKKLHSILICTAFAAMTASAGVDSGLLKLVMPDATILSGVNVDQSVMSPFGQYVLAQIQPNDPTFLQFISTTGFDPRKDLREILAATSSMTVSGSHTVLVLGRGTFQVAAIVGAATSNGGTITNYRGLNIISGPSGTEAVAFLDGSTAAMGDLVSVKSVIDRKIAGTSYSGPLASQAVTVSATNSAWFATSTPLSDFLSGKEVGPAASNNALLQSVQAASGGVQFSTTGVIITGDAVTRSPQDAQALVNVLQFVVSMLQSNTTNAQGQKAASIISNAQFAANGSVAHLSLTVPEQQAEQLLMPSARKAGRAGSRAAIAK